MRFFRPFRAPGILTIGSRILGRALFWPRFHFLRTAIVVLGIAALVSYFARRKETRPGT